MMAGMVAPAQLAAMSTADRLDHAKCALEGIELSAAAPDAQLVSLRDQAYEVLEVWALCS